MSTQNYKNHVRYYTPHHFIFYPVVITLLAISIRSAFRDTDNTWLWISISALWLVMGWLSFMLRQHYALNNQNRIVRLELRFRYYVLTQQRLEPIEQQLSFAQLAALRFASDDELPALVQKAVKENASPDEIKRSIKNWIPDDMRA